MATSSFIRIAKALEALLSQDPPVAQAIYRARSREVPKNVSTAICVHFAGAVPEAGAINGAPVDWTSRFTVQCLARAAASESTDDAVDDLVVEVYRRIAENATLNGLVDLVGEPMIEAEYEAEGERTGWVCLTYPVQHRTDNFNLE